MRRFVNVGIRESNTESKCDLMKNNIELNIDIHFRGEDSNHADIDVQWVLDFNPTCPRCLREEIEKIIKWTLESEHDFLINELTRHEDEMDENS